jgi:hypothetical protein
MSTIPANTSAIRIAQNTEVAFVTGGSRIQQGYVIEISENSVTIKKPDGTEVDILYEDISALYVRNINPSISEINGELSILTFPNESGQAITIRRIVSMRSTEELGGNYFTMNSDGSLQMGSYPSRVRTTTDTDSYSMMNLEVEVVHVIKLPGDRVANEMFTKLLSEKESMRDILLK